MLDKTGWLCYNKARKKERRKRPDWKKGADSSEQWTVEYSRSVKLGLPKGFVTERTDPKIRSVPSKKHNRFSLCSFAVPRTANRNNLKGESNVLRTGIWWSAACWTGRLPRRCSIKSLKTNFKNEKTVFYKGSSLFSLRALRHTPNGDARMHKQR